MCEEKLTTIKNEENKSTKVRKKRKKKRTHSSTENKTTNENKSTEKKPTSKSTKILFYSVGLLLGLTSVVGYAQTTNQSKTLKSDVKVVSELREELENHYVDTKTGLRKTDEDIEKQNELIRNYNKSITKLEKEQKTNTLGFIETNSKRKESAKYEILDGKKIIETYNDITTTEAILNSELTNEVLLTEKTVENKELQMKKDIQDENLNEVHSVIESEVKNNEVLDSANKVNETLKHSVETREKVKKLVKEEHEKINNQKLENDKSSEIKKLIADIKSPEEYKELENEVKKVEDARAAALKKIEDEKAIKEQEQVRQQEEQAQAANVSAESAKQSANSNNSSSQSNDSKPAQSAPQTVSTWGFSFLGMSYPIASYSGWGAVPADGNVYRWAQDPSHYLIERMGTAGAYIQGVGVGSTVYVEGQAYKVYKKQSGVVNNDNAGPYVLDNRTGGSISFQTCDSGAADTTLTIWWASPI